MSDIEKEFFEAFGIEPSIRNFEQYNYGQVKRGLEIYKEAEKLEKQGVIKITHRMLDARPENDCIYWEEMHYPPTTSDIVLGLEEILFKSVFYDGIHIHAPYDNEYNTKWSYQLTYYKGGYYTCGYGDTRKEALLDQFILIIEDSDVEQEEKHEISEEVKALFKC